MEDVPTPDLILDAAETLFARQGFAATTIKQIGVEAGANPALIYYYFRSKEGLYRGVLERVFGTIATNAGQMLSVDPSPGDAVRGAVGVQTAILAGRPSAARLIARELVDHELAHAGGIVADISERFFTRLCDLIRAGQQAGVFRAEMDPRFAAITVLSIVPYFHIASPVVGVFLGHGPQGPTDEEKRAYGRHAAEFVIAALTSASPPPGPPTTSPSSEPDSS
jgi:TetR/AcrR family transcriptional regulator